MSKVEPVNMVDVTVALLAWCNARAAILGADQLVPPECWSTLAKAEADLMTIAVRVRAALMSEAEEG